MAHSLGSSRTLTAHVALALATLFASTDAASSHYLTISGPSSLAVASPVHPRFDLSSPEATLTASPFPTDRLTVEDPNQLTGRRVALPVPADCSANASDCRDVEFLNRLDGFNLTPRITIPFDGDIDVTSVTGKSVIIVPLGSDSGRRIGVTQTVWDPETRTLLVTPDASLDEHARYALIVTRGVRDAAGHPIAPTPAFARRRAGTPNDSALRRYLSDLTSAERVAARAGVRAVDIAVASVFSTQSATYLTEKIVRLIRNGAAPPPVDFAIGTDGRRAVFRFDSIASLTWNLQRAVDGPLVPLAQSFAPITLVPNAVGRLAVGTLATPDFMVHPGEYIPEIATRTGEPRVQRTDTLSLVIALPAGTAPRGGWPVAISGHGSGRSNRDVFPTSSTLASHGFAVVSITMSAHGTGPKSTGTVTFKDGSTATFALPGRGIDQNGDGTIADREGDDAMPPRTLQLNVDAMVQHVADLTQLLRALRAGVDVDGDGTVDLDPNRIYYFGHSRGAMYGMGFVAFNPEIRAAVFAAPGAPLFENRRLSPGPLAGAGRSTVGALLAARTPPLLNAASGLTSLADVSVGEPRFNENLPLRGQPPLVNTVPGAIAIQRYIDRAEWIAQRGNPMVMAPLLRKHPPAGVPARPFLLQFARSDQSAPNPNTTAIIRAGDFADRTSYFRYDQWWATNQSAPKNAHGFMLQFAPPMVPVIRDAQTQIAEFFASDGARVVKPSLPFWQVPIADPLPEDLGYIP